MDINTFRDRIEYKGDLDKLFEKVSESYGLGKYISFSPILQGYEDFNIILTTEKGKYFVKVFAKFRDTKEVEQYIHMMLKALDKGIKHPKLLKNPDGYLYARKLGGANVSLAVMDYIIGEDFFRLQEKPSEEEMRFLAQQAAKINTIDFKPKFVYDSWAIPNFLKEYEKIKDKLENDDHELIKPLVEMFPKLEIEKLPHCFVHGDIISTNVMRADDGGLYIIDFAVANWYPRIQELAVLLCDLLFVPDKETFQKNYDLALNEYQKIIKLNDIELKTLPTYIKLAHAMHIIPSTREKLLNNITLPENEFWLKSGQEGLRFTTELWPN